MVTLARKLMDAPAASGYSCNVTTVDIFGAYYGYTNPAYGMGTFGSISAEPIPGEILAYVLYDSSPVITVAFFDDIVTFIDGFNIYFDGVNYGGAGDWIYNGGDNTTYFTAASGPAYVGGTFLLEIK